MIVIFSSFHLETGVMLHLGRCLTAVKVKVRKVFSVSYPSVVRTFIPSLLTLVLPSPKNLLIKKIKYESNVRQ